MASEVSIAKPLSGTESLEACLGALRAALMKDDRFSSHMAYSGFMATIQFKFYPQLSFIPPIERELIVTEGEQSGIVDLPTIEESIILPLRPPNQVREEAEMPQPVLVTDGQGRSTEKWVTRSSVPPRGVGRPKNKVTGA